MKNHRIGFYFPLPVVIIGAIISFIGVVSIIQVTVIGVFLPIGLFFYYPNSEVKWTLKTD